MKQTRDLLGNLYRLSLVAVSLPIVLLSLVAASAAEPGPPPETIEPDAVEWSSVDGGGGRTSGGTWLMVSAIGQPDAGSVAGGAYVLDGGFMAPDEEGETPLFADGFETGDLGAWGSVTP